MILGGGPNRIGQGIEFDYCCVHAALALREDGFETIMVNCNPETVSTDYDTSDRLYFEPLTLEDVLEILAKEKPEGVIVQFGGQTPLKLRARWRRPARRSSAPRPTRSTSPRTASASRQLLREARPEAAGRTRTARTEDAGRARWRARSASRWSCGRRYVLGGRAMEIVFDEDDLRALHDATRCRCPTTARCCSIASSTTRSRSTSTRSADGEDVLIGGIMEHIEEAGVHSGDSLLAAAQSA